MSISYELAPVPKWYIADLTGRPLGGGSMFTYRSLNKTEFKFIFQDQAGNFPWPDPVLFDENGSQGPFYWEIDTDNLDETYYIEVYDADGVLQWTIDDFVPPGGGGGAIITTALDLQNLIVNNVMWRNIGETANPIVDTFITLAPGANTGLAATPSNAGPDINFIKNNTTATDQIRFIPFTLGDTPLIGDITPVDYLNYACTNTPTGEITKCVQFPITSKVQNLNNEDVSVTIWARGNSGTTTLQLRWFQFFGDGTGASLNAITPIETINLTNDWVKYGPFSDTIPNVSGKILGDCGNDGLFLQVQFPLDASCNIDFTKPAVYLGNITPDQDYSTYDMIDGDINTYRTGDTRTSINNFLPGWVFMNDGTIGSASSGATNRANIDTFPLYNLIWNSVNNAWASVVGGRGADAITDFSADKPIFMTKALGRVFAGTLNTDVSQNFTADFTTATLTVSSTANFTTGVPVSVSNSGGALPSGLTAGVTYYAIQVTGTTMQLATTVSNAVLGIATGFSDNGNGTNTVQVTPYQLGMYTGEETHILTTDELAAHSHQIIGVITNYAADGGKSTYNTTGSPLGAGTTVVGSNSPHNNIQPTTYMNVFMKL